VFRSVLFCGFVHVVFRAQVMAVRNMRMMSRFLMRTSLMMLGSLFVVSCSVLMMLCCLLMVIGAFVLSHFKCLSSDNQ
jgi:hypothetical protein